MNNILVTGATGQLGKLVVNELLQQVSPEKISVLVRDPGKAIAWKKLGIHIIQGDYTDEESLIKAFRNTEKLYFISSSDKADRFGQHTNVVNAAAKAQIGHLFYTSAHRKFDDHRSLLTHDAHWQTDELIKRSNLKYTILKHSLYTELVPFFMGNDVLETGLIALPAGDGRASYATRADLAAAAAIVLTTEGHDDKTYSLGSEIAYSFANIAGMMTKLSGKDINYKDIGGNAYESKMIANQMEYKVINGTMLFCKALKEGEFDFASSDLAMLLGREPQSVEYYLRKVFNL